jgi:competence protein ComEC
MATATPPFAPPTLVPHRPDLPPPDVWRAPLIPLALAATAGIVLDRSLAVPVLVCLLVALLALFLWAAAFFCSRLRGQSVAYLALAVAALAAAYHHAGWYDYPADDVGRVAPDEPTPAELRGVLDDEPLVHYHDPTPLVSLPRSDLTYAVLAATYLKDDDWRPVSGRVQVVVRGPLEGLHVGDEVEVVGLLSRPRPPANPGEDDYAAALREQRITAEVFVKPDVGSVTRLAEGWPGSLFGWLAVCHGWACRAVREALPRETSGVAVALLLGRGSTMTHADWDAYKNTGVVYALALSGQQLSVLAIFLLFVLRRLFGVGPRATAVTVAGVLLGYTLLTGAAPSLDRACAMAWLFCGALVLRRPALTANGFALGWLTVIALNPADIFTPGCQFSFLAVGVIYWGRYRWFTQPDDPLDQAKEKWRPLWWKWSLPRLRWLGNVLVCTALIWLTTAPLAAARYHLFAPIGLLLAAPITLLVALAMITGFLFLLAAAVWWPLAVPFAWLTHAFLLACQWLVKTAAAVPGGHWFVSDVPDWWLWGYYLVVLSLLFLPAVQRRWGWALSVGVGWVCLGLLATAFRPPADELRVTFLAVGHGGCTVIETSDGRTLLYDAGSLGGPDVGRRQIAPYLWSRGVRRIDEVFLSHADLDHFNGLDQLLERFAVGRVSRTPTFAEKDNRAVQYTLAAIADRGVPVRILKSGDRLTAGDVELEVLHPPEEGVEGNENARSLVLLVRHAGHTVLLTGDLEGNGLRRVLATPAPPVDVMMAPHHGSKVANTPELAAWARPRVVVSCAGPPVGKLAEPYSATGARYLSTWNEGAVTVHSHRSGLVVETYKTGERFVVRP